MVCRLVREDKIEAAADINGPGGVVATAYQNFEGKITTTQKAEVGSYHDVKGQVTANERVVAGALGKVDSTITSIDKNVEEIKGVRKSKGSGVVDL